MILDDLRDSDKRLWQLRLQNLEKEHDRTFGSGSCKQTNTKDDIRKVALELIEKAAKPQYVITGNIAEERAKADEMMRLNEIKTQAMLGYINGVCAMARKLTEGGQKNDN